MWLFRSGIVLLAYICINIYTGVRLYGFAKYFFPSIKIFIFWPVYIVICYSFVLIYLLRLHSILPLRQAVMYSLPTVVYLFLAVFIMDLARLLLQHLHRIPRTPAVSAIFTGIALGIAVIIMIYGAINVRNIHTVHYNITLNKKSPESPLRVALISDLHIGAVIGRKWTANIVDAVNRTNPDLVLMAGDIFDSNLDTEVDLDGITAELRRFKATFGVYACAGNHDIDRLLLSTLREGGSNSRIHDFLKNAGITLLQDEVAEAAGICLIGRRDARPIGMSQSRKSAAELVSGLDKSRPIIFLDHQPVDYPREEAAGADLILSGHTHRGQFFPGNIATAYIYKKAGAVHYGYWKGRSAQGIVTSGAGTWGPAVRVATHSEVAVVDIIFDN